MKVLHLPCDVGGNAWGLAQGEKELGLESRVFYSYKSTFGYPKDDSLDLSQASARWCRLLKEISTFFSIRSKYDVFHFNAGTSLIPLRSSDWLRMLDLQGYPKKAKLFATYQGCEARQKKCTMQRTKISACHNAQCAHGLCDYGNKDDERKKCIDKMGRHVRHMWALNPDLLYFLPPEKSSFLPYTVAHYAPEKISVARKQKLTIVHAPTNQIIKGSLYIRETLLRLEKKYPGAFEIIWIEKMPHHEALQAYKQADLIIDQLLIGWYGAFTVEGMLMGKPVMVRIAEEDLHWIPAAMAKDLQEAIINANPFNLEEMIERCLTDHQWLQRKAEACFAYAQKWHHPAHVAWLTKEKYEE